MRFPHNDALGLPTFPHCLGQVPGFAVLRVEARA
ncbi:hypothetical protein ACVWZA_000826 [Sphingomonas sp. UYAg733]